MQSQIDRQTKYQAAPQIDPPTALPLPAPTADIAQAQADMRDTGLCILTDVLSPAEIDSLKAKLDAQVAAEAALGALTPSQIKTDKQIVSNMVNKGDDFLALVEREETDAIAGFVLGNKFLLASLTGHLFKGPTTEAQLIHRDQGQVPATAPFPAFCNLFYLLDDFTPERGSTLVVPGSHRWAPEHLVTPPPIEMAVQVEAPAGSLFAFEGRLWHGAGINQTGHARRSLSVFCCLPWIRQQENAGVTALTEVMDKASDKLKTRLGLRTYGTLGQMNGATPTREGNASFGSYDVTYPDYLIGEAGALHPLRRTGRGDTQ